MNNAETFAQMPRISAIICTYNRAAFVAKALKSLGRQTLAQEDFEVIVVDGPSSDSTRRVVDEMLPEHPNVRYEIESRIGLSVARNRGAEVASSPYLAYLDDDAQAEPRWLESVLTAFETCTPMPDCVGGPVLLDWGGDPPAWPPRRYWRLFSPLDFGDTGHFLRDDEYLVGANFAMRKAALAEVGGFDPRLGSRGRKIIGGDESGVLRELRNLGRPIYYEPKARVQHFVQPERLDMRWLRKRVFGEGASQPLLSFGDGRSRGFYAFQAYIDLRRTARFSCDYLAALMNRDQERRLDSALAVVQRVGRLRANLNLMLARKN